jgi:predicted Zn-dependent protease
MREAGKRVYWTVVTVLLGATLVVYGLIGWDKWFSIEAQHEKIQAIYAQIIAATGQVQNALPLVIIDENVDNAYNDGKEVVIYQGLIDHTNSWDEIAMVLGHEVSHGMLGHLDILAAGLDDDQVAVLEANADKMGALYMMKAGYDICKGRQLFKHWKEQNGNALGQNHPDFSYRYDELKMPWCSND